MNIMLYIIGVIVGVFFLTCLCLLLYFTFSPITDQIKHTRRRKKKRERLKCIVIPVGPTLGKWAFKEATRNINDNLQIKIDEGLNNIKTINTSIGPDGICYITVWYKIKERVYIGEARRDLPGAFSYNL